MKPSRQAAVLLLGAGLLLSGCSYEDLARGESNPTLPARTVDADGWRQGPKHPKEHTPYPYDMYTHCGIKWAHFGGRWWVLDTVFNGAPQVEGEPAAPHTQTLAGYMTLIGPDTANFDTAGMPTLQFVPAESKPPGCA
ncbi:hypothetical protein [Streptomyces sp. NPDC026673]|uniref:hypothetical protein n=1 Tax=Streptomyces sp. NPDC026673 TaxID=3155724 RepID=UPI0033D0C7A7